MTTVRHDIEVIGAIRPEIQSQLSDYVNTKAGDANEHRPALLDASAGFDSAAIESLLEQGRTLVLLSPSSESRELLMNMTGSHIADTDAVALKRNTNGQYRFSSTAGITAQDSTSISENGSTEAAAHLINSINQPPLGARIAGLINGLAKKPLLAAGAGSLIGPAGSYSGEVRFNQKLSGVLGPVAENFPRATGKSQPFDSNGETTFYVYYVEDRTSPHYVVIAKQQLSYSAGTIMINQDCNRGCGMYQAASEIRGVSVNAGNVNLVYSSPDSESAVAKVREEMRLRQNVQGGTSILPTIIEDATSLSLTDWTVNKRSSHGVTSAGWEFIQSNLRYGFGDITQTIFNGQTVKPYSVIATSTLSVTTFAVWRITNNPKPILNLGLEMVQSFMIMANGGCRKNQDYRGGNMHTIGTGVQHHSLDLAAITRAPV
ncbi:hypothetical protein ACO0LD_18575 [Undibacterium sp. Ji83W]|uniref:hypothetical protein n=1 Tax=Undibacterium sp. Ji83W TaxID=3413043 RepID=UPI003BEF7D87